MNAYTYIYNWSLQSFSQDCWPSFNVFKYQKLRVRFDSTHQYTHCWSLVQSVFSFLPKIVHFIKWNAILCLFLKNVSPSKRVICFIPNNSHLSMVEGIVFYALYKSKMLIIPCKADESCLFIGLPDEIYKKVPDIVIQFRS